MRGSDQNDLTDRILAPNSNGIGSRPASMLGFNDREFIESSERIWEVARGCGLAKQLFASPGRA